MPYELFIQAEFSAAHNLRAYKGKCEHLHGHNYRVRVTLEGERLDSAGLLADFSEIKRLLHSLIERWDHRLLNEVPPFDVVNPTAENMARYFYEEMARGLEAGAREVPVRLAEVKIWETDTATAAYHE